VYLESVTTKTKLTCCSDQQQVLQAQIRQLSVFTRAGVQQILDHQRALHDSTSLCLANQNQLTTTVFPVTAPDLEDGVADLLALEQSMRVPRTRLKKGSTAFTACTCPGSYQASHVSRGPIVFSLSQIYPHTHHCPSWVPGAGAMNASLGLILCYLALGLKFRIFMALAIGTGTFSITPSLACHRIVSRTSSPAFGIIDEIGSFKMAHLTFCEASAKLSKIFRTQQASPHDRLINGQTVLHVSTHVVPIYPQTQLSFISICATDLVKSSGPFILPN
jgi:hypothetical protein